MKIILQLIFLIISQTLICQINFEQSFEISISSPKLVRVCDVDSDSDFDFVYARNIYHEYSKLFFLENDGMNNFEETEIFNFTFGYNGGILQIDYSDIDADGDLDIIISYYIVDSNSERYTEISIFINNGTNIFEQYVIYHESHKMIYDFTIIDFDFDNDLDIVSASTGLSSQYGFITFHANEGNNNFSSQHLIQIDEQYGSVDLEIADIDEDYDYDIIFSVVENYNYVYENIGNNSFEEHTGLIPCPNHWYSGVELGDLDSDGDLDILYFSGINDMTGYGRLSWFENLADFNYLEHILGQGFPFEDLTSGYMVDLDCDGDIDLITNDGAGSDHPHYWKNNGSQNFATSQINGLPTSEEIFIVDYNQDDYKDIVFSNTSLGRIALFENTSNTNIEEINLPNLTNVSLTNYPNPFNPSTSIEFSIQNDSKVDLSIYNIKGQKIKTLVHNEYEKGSHSVIWDGDDENCKQVSSGLYLYKLNVNNKIEAVKKCLLLK